MTTHADLGAGSSLRFFFSADLRNDDGLFGAIRLALRLCIGRGRFLCAAAAATRSAVAAILGGFGFSSKRSGGDERKRAQEGNGVFSHEVVLVSGARIGRGSSHLHRRTRFPCSLRKHSF